MTSYRHHPDPLISDAIESVWATHPYYASALGKLRIVADANVPTMATSASWVTHYNPETVAGWTPSERGAVLVHELEHLLRRHHERCGDRDPAGFNVAGDAEINQRLSGLPAGAIYPETLGMPRGQSAETYYGASGQGKRPEPGDGDPGDGDPGDGPGDGGNPGGKCGSAAGGPVQPHEVGDAANPGDGALDVDATRREAAQHVLQSPVIGNGESDALREWAEAELGIDRAAWYSALSAAVGHVMAPYGAPTRWAWPGRRDPRDMGGAMVPRWTGERPACAVVIDTSGSISAMDIDMARAAGHYIGRVADATYYGCNVRATKYGTSLPDSIKGGGGTDLRVGIAMAIADGARAVVVITDCMTPWPDDDPGIPVIIGANPTGSYMAHHDAYAPPSWMTVLPIVDPS